MSSLKFERFFWLFLFVGIGLRCVAINQPLVDAHLIRQCQTAAATESLINLPGINLSSRVPWSGDIDERYLQEFPLYNYLAIALYRVIGNLDVSGKVTSILLWALSFLCLQFIWRRILDPEQTTWANLLFVVAPLSVFFGQAFMPEMLVQLLAFSFVLVAIRYDETPSLGRWIFCATVGLASLIVKLPEVAHLYVILVGLVFSREGANALVRPRYLIAAALTIVAYYAWLNYEDSVNVGPLSFGSTQERMQTYIGPLSNRFRLELWAMLGLYLTAFVASGPQILIIAYGLWNFLRRQREKILGLWLLSLLLFYLVWFGYTATSHSYYNLPALAPLCALFAIGMQKLLSAQIFAHWRRPVTIAVALFVILSAVLVCQYLFRQDRQLLAAANWVRANTQPGDLILFRPNHRADMINYPFNPVMTYYGKRQTVVWTRETPPPYRQAALERARYAVVTLRSSPPTGLRQLLNRFRHSDHPVEPTDWLETSGFHVLAKERDFVVYIRNSS